MANSAVSIAVVAPANRLAREIASEATRIAGAVYGDRARLFFHPQCFLTDGHFAGSDKARSDAFLEVANDAAFDAVWFARGGYGSCRLDDALFARLNPAARRKTYMGYSDMGFLLGRLAREGVGAAVHGPMPADIARAGGEAAVRRALSWLVDRDEAALEPSWRADAPAFAFNLTVLSALLGTPAEPDFTGAVLMLEDIDEQHYRLDRAMFHISSSAAVRRAVGVRLGRVSKIPVNDPPFERTEEEIVKFWCEKSGLAYLGAADIGHDVANRVVPFPQSSRPLS